MNKTTILIADDHTLIRETWSFILNTHPCFSVVGECGSGEAAVKLAGQLRPQVALIDINLPGISGLEATALIRKASPASRILGISMHTHPSFARQMIQKGASGYVTKSSPREELFRAISEILTGKKFVCQEIKDALSEQMVCGDRKQETLHALTARELQVIAHIARGKTSREIGAELGLSVNTVEVHRYRILQKLQLKNTIALIQFIHQNRLTLPS